MDFVLAHLAVLQLADHRRGAERDLVHAVLAVDDEHVLAAEPLQHAHLDADQVGMEHADQLVRRAGRVGERPEDVEDRAHAELLAHRRRVLHRAVVDRREHEADAGLADALRDLLGRQHDVGAERLQHVGAAGFRRHRAAAVLGDPRAGRRGDEHRRGRDVEGVRRVAAGADDVDQMLAVGDLDLGRELAHHLRRGGDLADGLLLHAQADGERRDHHRRHLAAHDLAHDRQHLVVEDLAMLDGALERILHGQVMTAPLARYSRISVRSRAIDG